MPETRPGAWGSFRGPARVSAALGGRPGGSRLPAEVHRGRGVRFALERFPSKVGPRVGDAPVVKGDLPCRPFWTAGGTG